MAKQRPPQGKIAGLTDAQRKKVHQWLRQNLSYTEVKARIWTAFGVSMSVTSLCNYYTRHSFEICDDRPCEATDLENPSLEIRAVALAPGAQIQVRLVNGWIALRAVRPAPVEPALSLKEEKRAA